MFDKNRFKSKNLNEAKNIILTPHEGKTTKERWEVETEFLVNLISDNFQISQITKILDYGCGIGRIAKELIDKFNCNVVGVDSSEEMRNLSSEYIQSERFKVYSVEEFYKLNLKFDLVYSIWTLQHILEIENAIEIIKNACNNKLLVINMTSRCIPCEKGRYSDYKDIKHILDNNFVFRKDLGFQGNFFSEWYHRFAFIRIYESIIGLY